MHGPSPTMWNGSNARKEGIFQYGFFDGTLFGNQFFLYDFVDLCPI